MITIIRYPGDMYYGVVGFTDIPLRSYSGFIDEDRELALFYRERCKIHERAIKLKIYLNKVLVKKALDREISNWTDKISYPMYKEYAIYHLHNATIEELTQQTPEFLFKKIYY
jgi:hypothetical protein